MRACMRIRHVSIQERESQRRVAIARAIHRRAREAGLLDLSLGAAVSIAAGIFLPEEATDLLTTLGRQPQGWPRRPAVCARNNLMRAVRRAATRDGEPSLAAGRRKRGARSLPDARPDLDLRALLPDPLDDGLDALVASVRDEVEAVVRTREIETLEELAPE